MTLVERTGPVGVRHLSIEEQGREWAKAMWLRGGGDLQQTVLVAHPKDLPIRSLPPFVGENFGLRLDAFGVIYGSRWRSVSRQQLGGYDLLYPDPVRVRQDYLTNLPASRQHAALLEFASFDTIETAIRAQKHVIDASQEGGLPQAQAVVDRVNRFAQIVLAQRLTDERLTWLAGETETFLAGSGLVSARKPAKAKMTATLQLAWHHDRLNRVNAGATRFRLRSAYLLAVGEQIFAGRVAEKYTKNLIQLDYEREIERWVLAETGEALNRKVLWDAAFETARAQTPIQRLVLSHLVSEIDASLLTIPRARPYLAAARLVSIALVGCPPERLELDRLIAGDVAKFNRLVDQPSVKQLIEANEFSRAAKRINQLRDYLQRQLAV